MDKLEMVDLMPQEAVFSLSEKPGKTYVLKKYSLLEQIWARTKFGNEKIKEIVDTQDIFGFAEIAYHLLKDKSDFPSFEDFASNIIGPKDSREIKKAVLTTIGLSQPVLDEMAKKEQEEAAKNPNE